MQSSLLKQDYLVSAKRTNNERQGVHQWHPYYAGYAERFVDSAIDYLNLNTSKLILDPWNGSGTTALVAARHRIRSIGLDVNPVMNIFSMSKAGVILNNKTLIIEIAGEITKSLISSPYKILNDDPLLDFMSPSLCSGVKTLYELIDSCEVPLPKLKHGIKNTLKKTTKDHQNPLRDFLVTSLFIAARQTAGYKGGSNPTWVKTLEHKPVIRKNSLANVFLKKVQEMMNDISNAYIRPCNEVEHLAIRGDSREIPLKDYSVDAVITSPPYLTRVDYAMSTRPELLIIGDEINLRQTRELTMGAPVIVDKTIQANPLWGESCNILLNVVENHSTKASRSYYLPNMLQYFRDAEFSLKEIVRVMKDGGKALVVVQSSYFKEHEIPLGKIYIEMCEELPVKASIVYRDTVRGHMAHVNTKSTQYKKNKVFYEDVIEITKS